LLILLPPSETKRDGGDPQAQLDLAALSFPELTKPRRAALAGLRAVSRSLDGSMAALKLGPTQRFEIERNRSVKTSGVMPAVERYTGVLYDALDVASLGPAAREFLGRHVVIHSALFGLVRADDPLPAYRFSHDSRIPGTSLARLWSSANAAVLAQHDGLILDLRSESYVHLGPAPGHGVFLRVVTEGDDGTRRALNHFNKHGKGDLVRRLAENGEQFDTVDALVGWARAAGIRLEPGPADSLARELVLIV
jgi:cytoplasmic iron level regulating protein YaaA (DUF328/UPF0246 family)